MSGFVNPAQQAMNIIRYVGEQVSNLGKPISLLAWSHIEELSISTSSEMFSDLMRELFDTHMVYFTEPHYHIPDPVFFDVNLKLTGWEKYEQSLRGELAGNYGFLAMGFNDKNLEAFVQEVLKPTIEENLTFDLIDMRDVSRAGLIDNIMGTRIRECRFLIADLTHDNNGAYWEAGYAEGMGKPVIYICEQEKFKSEGTHFDTNHYTTILWSWDEVDKFKADVVATIKRSLDSSN